MLEFIPLDQSLLNDMYKLTEEYFSWIDIKMEELYKIDTISIIGQTIPEYVRSSINDLSAFIPPKGIYYLIRMDEKTIGMGALRKLKENLGEIKRMYIKPEYRGRGYGKKLLQELLKKAIQYKYSIVRLDTGKFMTNAQRVYRLAGFQVREEYPESEVPQQFKPFWLFMEKSLTRNLTS